MERGIWKSQRPTLFFMSSCCAEAEPAADADHYIMLWFNNGG